MHAFTDRKFQRNKVLIKTEAKDSKHTFLSQSLQKLKPNKDERGWGVEGVALLVEWVLSVQEALSSILELIYWTWWNVHVILAFGRWRQGN